MHVALYLNDVSIELAEERGEDLLFLYVVSVGFIDQTARAIRRGTAIEEMRKMGRFLLKMAMERAWKQDVTAGFAVHCGDLRDELKVAAHDPTVSAVMLGRPANDHSIFTERELMSLAAEIEAETNTQVYVL